jgi:16S rRNA (uracil1498-N3)-methyltransferase
MSLHRVMVDSVPDHSAVIGGEEAHHALRVKRLAVGDRIELLDGRGTRARAAISDTRKLGKSGGWEIVVLIEHLEHLPRPSPLLHVLTGVPKGERFETLVDQLSQVGAASWAMLRSQHATVDPSEHRLERLSRIAGEASKQCGRAWSLTIEPERTFDDVLRERAPRNAGSSASACVVAHVSGGEYRATGAEEITLLIGPQGDWSERELRAARDSGVQIATFGQHVMRVETAAAAAASCILYAERVAKGEPR